MTIQKKSVSEGKSLCHYITAYFESYLVNERGVSNHTLRSYGLTIAQLIEYLASQNKVRPGEVKLDNLNKKNVQSFLDYLVKNHSITDSTRNHRLACIKSFVRYLEYEEVTRLSQWECIMEIAYKNTAAPNMSHLSIDGIKLLLSGVKVDTALGKRDLALLSLMYESAARVQEIIDLSVEDIHLCNPAHVQIMGKGRKRRIVPISDNLRKLLTQYIESLGGNTHTNAVRPLFTNRSGGHLSAVGVDYILSKYLKIARDKDSSLIPNGISPHSLRHSRAMHLLQCGCDLIYIKDILGHSSLRTTQIYAKADSKTKRDALVATYGYNVDLPNGKMPWQGNDEMLKWLHNIGK